MRFCDPDIVAMTRTQLYGVGPTDLLLTLSKENYDLFVKDCDNLMKNPTFHLVIDHIMMTQRDYAMNKAREWEEVKFARGQISGASLVREFVQAKSSDLPKAPAWFDKNDVI